MKFQLVGEMKKGHVFVIMHADQGRRQDKSGKARSMTLLYITNAWNDAWRKDYCEVQKYRVTVHGRLKAAGARIVLHYTYWHQRSSSLHLIGILEGPASFDSSLANELEG